MNSVITIGRQFGSGGHEVGLRLSKKLGIPFYDREILSITAQNSRFAESYLKKLDERKPSFLNFSAISALSTTNAYSMLSPNDEVFIEVGKVIRELAEKGPCVIVGRCADYILRDIDTIDFFVCADLKDRIARKLALEEHAGLTYEEMEKIVVSTDKGRAKFHEYYAQDQWGVASNYCLCVNTSKVGIDGAVDVMAKFVESYKSKSIMPD